MKKQFVLSVLCLLMMAPIVHGATVDSCLATCTFNIPGKGPFLETYLSVLGKGITYRKNNNGKFQGAIEVSIRIKKDTTTFYTDRYNLLSPETSDTTKDLKDFIDQQRIPLPNGDYVLSLGIVDKNNREKPFEGKTNIHVNYPENVPAISGIELLESFNKTTNQNILTKNGYDLIPFISNYYPKSIHSIKFYAEVYNSKKIEGNKYLVKYYIEQSNSKKILGDYSRFIKMNPEEVNVVMAELPIDSLPSGNYNLVVEVRNNKDEMIAYKDYFFQRQNAIALPQIKMNDYTGIDINNTFVATFNNKDTLFSMILSLRPISNQMENDFTDNYFHKDTPAKDSLLMKKYFYDFWVKRDDKNPAKAWAAYREQVIKVQKLYGTAFRKGYDTDRGRIYLRYGTPNIITPGSDDPAALPYEIWQYYVLNNQSNRKFLFYEPNEGNNEYVILHSDVKGEIQANDWQKTLYNRSYTNHDIDATKVPDRIGGRSNIIFDNPR